MDISKKYEIEYRLLHAVTIGCSWYGMWGYEFGAGSFGITVEAYHKAVETLSNVPLAQFFTHDRSPRTRLQNTISLYQLLAASPLVTVRHLFCCVLDLIHNAKMKTNLAEPFDAKKSTESVTSGVLCAWTKEEVGLVEQAIIKVLRAVDVSRWVTWRALRGASCKSVASPELLDYSLKGLGGKCFGSMVVAVRCNSDTKAIEYKLEAADLDKSYSTQLQCRPSVKHLFDDLKFLYNATLNPLTMQTYKPLAIQEAARSSAIKLLDCKQFVKHYERPTLNGVPSNPFALRIWCHAELTDQPKDCTAPPPELLVLPVTATVADLKLEASKAFRESYVLFHRFQAEQLMDYGHVSDSTNVKLLLGLNGTVRLRGSCSGDERRLWHFRMERGPENWSVDCACGAKDDDGERMMACDVCEVWGHTRCSGVSDDEEVPAKFVCAKCVARNNKNRGHGGGRYRDSSSNGRCKDDIDSTAYEVGRCGHHLIV